MPAPLATLRNTDDRIGALLDVHREPPLKSTPGATADAAVTCFRRRLQPARGTPVESKRRHAVWWLWPHLLSLDAPIVAVVWQICWASAAHVRLPWCDPCVLGLGVWLIYLADRLVDSARVHPGDAVTTRHAFHGRRRSVLSILAAGVAAMLVMLTPCVLGRREFLLGMCLLGFAGVYFWLIHGQNKQGWTLRLPKEAAVGGLFAAGTVFFPWYQGGMSGFALRAAAILFGGLCFCNCALITVWERHAQDVRNRCSLLNAFPWLSARLGQTCLLIACLAGLGSALAGSTPFLALALGGLCLAVLDRHRDKLSTDCLRVLADTALLTPLLIGIYNLG